MPVKKPSKPWLVKCVTPGGPVETKHRSCPEAYRAVTAEKDRIANGDSRTQHITVNQWNTELGYWDLYERVYPER
ncbi:hypothetical protein [Streptomyces sp. AA1529]|uniref:hypothetical protein n=1 Tax=Streptomyces sp. AA1529 TaxID=1203257 RepID=UPI0009984433|nr:hypothetical protein [Streptomyces sp. AA1529]